MERIEKNYQIMTYAEMAKFINDMEFNKVYSFSTYWEKDKEYPEHYSFGIWYGFIKQRLFDTTVITLGAFGGMDVHAFDYGYNATLEKSSKSSLIMSKAQIIMYMAIPALFLTLFRVN